MNPWIVEALKSVSSEKAFQHGRVVRYERGFAPEMFLLLDGELAETLGDGGLQRRIRVPPPSIIGEIGYLTGRGASARVEAVGDVRGLAIGAKELAQLERDHPVEAAELQRELARIARERQQENQTAADPLAKDPAAHIEVRQCTTPDLLRIAQNLRYEVYCGEFGRSSPYADHGARTLIDPLDGFGASFVAYAEGKPIGTNRVNFARDGDLGILSDIYGMAASPRHPLRTCIITKYAIREAWRGGPAYMNLFAAVATYIGVEDIDEIYIDCNPALARFYATMGFKQTNPEFMHYENGLSYPMILDIPDYLARMPLDERRARNRWR